MATAPSALLERISDACVSLDREWRCTYVNRRAGSLFGRHPEQLVGKRLADELPYTVGEAFHGACLRAAAEQAPVPVETYDTRLGRTLEGQAYPDADGVTVLFRDITHQRQTEEAVRHHEQRMRSLLEHIQDVVFLIDRYGFIRYVSSSVEQVLGFATATYQDRSAFDTVHPEDLAQLVGVFTDVVSRPGATWRGEFRMRHGDGGWRSMEVVGRSLLHDPAVQGVLVTARDVTQRREAEQALRTSQALFRSLIENSDDVIGICDADGTIRFGNSSIERVLGYPLERVTGSRIHTYVHPDDLPLLVEGLRSRSRRPGRGRTLKLRLRHADGSWRTFEAHGFNLLAQEAVRGIVVTARDVTERARAEDVLRASEELFRSLIENSIDMVGVLGPDGETRYANPAVARALGYRQEAMAGENVLDYIHPDDLATLTARLHTRSRAAGAGTVIEFRIRHANGSWRTFEASAHNLLDQPVVRGLLISARDITERRELESQLLQSQKMESIGRLAGGVAHDFNNLLTVILGNATILLSELPETDPMRMEVEEIHGAADRAAGLTRQLLAFGRKQALQPRVLDLNGVLRQAYPMLRRLVRAGISLDTVCHEELGRVRVDPNQIEQVLLNLVVNANDAVAPEGGRITVRTANRILDAADPDLQGVLEPGRYVSLTVEDDGCGIDPAALPHVFEPFFTTKAVGEGTGLGLATVYGVVKQSGGLVRATSQPGHGSTFEVLLPHLDDGADTHAPGPVHRDVPGGRETVLLVEDEPAVRDFARRVLERSGYTVRQACDGEQALAMLAEQPRCADLLLTDVIMPRMGGHLLARRARAADPQLRVVFMSGYAGDALTAEGNLDADACFVQKPFTADTLTRTVRAVLDAPSPGAAPR